MKRVGLGQDLVAQMLSMKSWILTTAGSDGVSESLGEGEGTQN